MARPTVEDTIAAIATAPGVGGIGIVRISGPEAESILQSLFRRHRRSDSGTEQRAEQPDFLSHRLYYGTVVNRQGAVLDEAMAVLMRAPQSYTREDVVEIQSHGSYPVLQTVLSEVLAAGARLAEPGEFTKRAFLAGRIDLTQAEAVIDLLQAQTSGSARLAMEHLQGSLYSQVNAIRDGLVEMLAVVEVAIDFPDDDVEILETDRLLEQLQGQVQQPLRRLLALAEQGKIIREGVKVVIAGRPNVGKSSLLNSLLCEERALVTDIPGTTRDTIEELISVRGIPVHLVDTAGIRDHDNAVEGLGIERARQKLEQADLVLFVVDAAHALTELDRELYRSLGEKQRLIILNKCDIAEPEQLEAINAEFSREFAYMAGNAVQVQIAAKAGQGIDALLDALYQVVVGTDEGLEELSCAPNLRHTTILQKALAACVQVEQTLVGQEPADLLAVDLQAALDHLADIVGLTTPDDVLDAVFSTFCIGK